MSTTDKLEALLAAASPGPWYSDAMHSVCNLQGGFLRPPQWAIEAKHGIELAANARLAALALALAREVLDRRKEGVALAEAARWGEDAWNHWNDCDDCGSDEDGEHWCNIGAPILHEASGALSKALACWAKLREDEERDG